MPSADAINTFTTWFRVQIRLQRFPAFHHIHRSAGHYVHHLPAHPLLSHTPTTPPTLNPSPHSPHCFWAMESPWYIFRAAELVYRHPLSLALFSQCCWPEPAIRSHAMCSLSSRGAQLFAGGTYAGARMNDWHSGDLPGWQPPAGVEDCFRTGCRGSSLCHSSAVGMLSPGQKAAKWIHTLKGQLWLVFIKSVAAMPQTISVQVGSVLRIVS